jgi:hypothetical protein
MVSCTEGTNGTFAMSEIAGSPLSVSGARLGDRHDQPAADGIVHDSWNVRPAAVI